MKIRSEARGVGAGLAGGPHGRLLLAAFLAWATAWAGHGAAGDAALRAALAVLRDECASCHGEAKQKSGLSFASHEALMKGSDDGPVLVPGDPGRSRLLAVLEPKAENHMPPKRQLSRDQIQAVRDWIQGGARWDDAVMAGEPEVVPVRLKPLPPGHQPAHAVAWSPDGTRLAVARGGTLGLYRLDGTNLVRLAEAAAHVDAIQDVAWSPDGRFVASGGFQRVRTWTGDALKPVLDQSAGLAGRVTALAFGGDGVLAVGDAAPARAGHVRLIEGATTGTGRWAGSWRAHGDGVLDMAFSADGQRLVTAGGDHLVRVWDATSRKEVATLEGHTAQVLGVAFNTNATQVVSGAADRTLKVWDIATKEKIIALGGPVSAYNAVAWSGAAQAIHAVTDAGALMRYNNLKTHTGEQSSASGDERRLATLPDATLALSVSVDGSRIVASCHDGSVHVLDGDGKVLARLEPPPSPVSGLAKKAAKERASAPSFVRDVLPALNQAGCASGGCHSKPEGQNGFKLSVFSYDPASDHAEIVREARGRRVLPSAPDQSLLLLKPLGLVPHEGGQRFKPGSPTHDLLVRWIRGGMPYSLTNEPVLQSVVMTPAERAYKKGGRESLRVEARYSDGSRRDVTALAAYESSDKELVRVEPGGRMTVGRITGQGVVVARFMGLVAATQVTVPAERTFPASRYAALETNNFIDALAHRQFQRLGLLPSALCTDAEFVRRAKLDTLGMLPTPDEVAAFLADGSPDKRRRYVDALLEQPAYGDFWANQWADLLRPNPDRVGVKSVFLLDQWLRERFRENQRYDAFVREILMAEGSNHRSGAAVIYRDRREPAELTTMFSQLFLGTRLECAKCHHHPSEKWGQEDFYQLAAYFGPLKQKGAGLSPPISAGTETFYYAPGGSVRHPVSGVVMEPRAPDGPALAKDFQGDPRRALADWLTSRDNPFFARAAVNRAWGHFLGRGLVHPVDDFRASNPCVNTELLDALAADFAGAGYDWKHLFRTILNSRTYQLSSEPNETNLGDTRAFSRGYRRRLRAEVVADALSDATGVPDALAAMPPGGRAMQAWSYKIESHLLDAFGRPNSSSDCPCERDASLSVVQSLHLMNSRALQAKMSDPKGRLHGLAEGTASPAAVVTEIYMVTLGRRPTERELETATAAFAAAGATRKTAVEDVFWALINSPEFLFNH